MASVGTQRERKMLKATGKVDKVYAILHQHASKKDLWWSHCILFDFFLVFVPKRNSRRAKKYDEGINYWRIFSLIIFLGCSKTPKKKKKKKHFDHQAFLTASLLVSAFNIKLHKVLERLFSCYADDLDFICFVLASENATHMEFLSYFPIFFFIIILKCFVFYFFRLMLRHAFEWNCPWFSLEHL